MEVTQATLGRAPGMAQQLCVRVHDVQVSADSVLQSVPLLRTAVRVAYSTVRYQGMPASNNMAHTHTAISSENSEFCSGEMLEV